MSSRLAHPCFAQMLLEGTVRGSDSARPEPPAPLARCQIPRPAGRALGGSGDPKNPGARHGGNCGLFRALRSARDASLHHLGSLGSSWWLFPWLQHRHTPVLSPCPKRPAPRWAPGTAGTAPSPRCSHAYSIGRRQPRGGSRKKARPRRHQRAPRNPRAARCPWHCPPVPPERAPAALGRHGAAAGRAAGPWRGFPKKGLNSSFEFATSLTTPFPVRGCVRLLFFSLTFFFSLPSPCPPSRAMPRSRR